MVLIVKLALRELRGGIKGFGVFLACIALGVAAISGVSSLSRALSEGLAREGRTILGGDMAFTLLQREASGAELNFLREKGTVGIVATLRAMAVAGEKGSALVEIKAVDDTYPMVGALKTLPEASPLDLLENRNQVFGAVVDPVLLARLNLVIGDEITIGQARVQLRASLVSEPDKIAAGIGFGPRLILSQQALRAAQLLQPGALVRWNYRVVLPPSALDEASLIAISEEAAQRFPEAGWEIRSRSNADPRFAKNIERFTQFLTLVGLTALIVGGVGVANAVKAFVDRKRASIATLKSLGAPGGQVVMIYLTQIMLIALIGIMIGMVLGAAMPFAVAALFNDILPLPLSPTIAGYELMLALAYGLLTAFVFALAPLGRAHDVPVSSLFRDKIASERAMPRRVYLIMLALAFSLLVGVVLLGAYDKNIALIFIGAMAGIFLLLRLIAQLMMSFARMIPRPRHPGLRLAITNLHRPGALTPSLVLSLGLGITLLVTLALIDSNLRNVLTKTLPERAPSFFFLDIANQETARFDAFLKQQSPDAVLERVPMMRGRLVTLKNVPVSQIKAKDEIAWVLDGDRGITYKDVMPEGSSLVAGSWWAQDYQGPPLVSFEAEVAEGLGLGLGDEVVVNVLGRNIKATIANLRKVEWRNLSINFVMVFSSNTFAGAPHTHLATLSLPKAFQAEQEALLLKTTAQAFPNVTSVRVKDALQAIETVVAQLALAIRGASALALLASVLVLAGALAASHRSRLYDAVILKTLGATRPQLLAAYAFEYGILGVATAIFGLFAGTLSAYGILTFVMKTPFIFAPMGALLAAALAVIVSITLGLAGTSWILAQKPAHFLRNL
jgi:putative ABC transport system permease protein